MQKKKSLAVKFKWFLQIVSDGMEFRLTKTNIPAC